MVYIESAEAKKELGRIDDILNEKHLLIGGLAVKYFYPARESKDKILFALMQSETRLFVNYILQTNGIFLMRIWMNIVLITI